MLPSVSQRPAARAESEEGKSSTPPDLHSSPSLGEMPILKPAYYIAEMAAHNAEQEKLNGSKKLSKHARKGSKK